MFLKRIGRLGSFRGDRIHWKILGHTAASRCEGSTKPPAHPEGGGIVTSRNVGKPSHLDAAVCPRKFRWILNWGRLGGGCAVLPVHTTPPTALQLASIMFMGPCIV